MTTLNSKYCNLLTTGEGLVVDIHTERTRWGQSLLACHIKALHGLRDKAEYLDYDARVVGKQAERLIRKAQNAVNAGCDVLIAFKAGVRWLSIIKYDDDHPRAGEIDIVQKARLLFVHWMDVDGVRVYTAEASAVRDGNAEDALTGNDSSDAATPKPAAAADVTALAASA
ncbi:hypothetical protein GCM10011487_11800 [Steroidobacter agaridevorans]|uniref:Uncharacterized protein n=1 Tax=Steroidobacter agaridevorans TaxID=2695856 RepID=A0A829Y7J3_9GAMM|nr:MULTISPECIES: DUF3577 domain-containing protein [Steroidobacteraceae]GFE79180.1 hypothetical protein GCM10011487_11800 [Steroidobacter agaridevorans]